MVNDLGRGRCHVGRAACGGAGPYPEPMPAQPAGLCDSCRHQQVVRTKRSSFSLCRRWKEDDRFARYPRLPVLRCPGFEQHERAASGAAGASAADASRRADGKAGT